MRKVLKWIGVILGTLVGLVLIAVAVVFGLSQTRLNQVYTYLDSEITIPSDRAAVERGQHIAQTRGCTECHGANLAGTEFINEPSLAVISAPNLTRGDGGIGSTYTDEDWVRALRHGVRPGGTGLIIMPSQFFTNLADQDLGALIAYLKSVEPVDNPLPQRQIGLLGRVMLVAGVFETAPEMIEHEGERSAPPEGPTTEYGDYLVSTTGCADCHGPDLAGMVPPGAPQGSPPSPNLTPAGDLGSWSVRDFILAIQTGARPDGDTLDPAQMPWPYYSNFSDDELSAIFYYLQSLPPTQPAQ